jgi:hypothetical protein
VQDARTGRVAYQLDAFHTLTSQVCNGALAEGKRTSLGWGVSLQHELRAVLSRAEFCYGFVNHAAATMVMLISGCRVISTLPPIL